MPFERFQILSIYTLPKGNDSQAFDLALSISIMMVIHDPRCYKEVC